MSKKIWYTSAFTDPANVLPFWSTLNEEIIPPASHYGASLTKQGLDALERNRLGEPLPADRFPSKIFHIYSGKYRKKIKPIMNSGFYYVRGDAADIIRAHDMGNSSLYPVELFKCDQKTRLDVEMYTLNVGNLKKTICLEQSKLRKVPYQLKDFYYIDDYHHKSNDTTVIACRDALDGPDIWVDPAIWDAVFISDRLVRAFKIAGLTRTMRLKAVRVSED